MSSVLQIRAHEARRIESCHGDFEEISSLIESSWGENQEQPLSYGPEFLASCFEYPGASFSLAPTVYEGPSPLAFVAAFPRRVDLAGQRLDLATITFLTVASEHKKRGYGIVLWNEAVRRIRDAGFDGMVNYCVDGEPMNGMIQGCCRMQQLPTACVHSVPYWSRVLPPGKLGNVSPEANEGRVDRFLELAGLTAQRTALARLWNREEAEWQLLRRFGAVAAEFESGSRCGMLTGYIMPVANANRTKCLMIEDVLWGELEPQERVSLVRKFLDRAVSSGAQIAVLPVLGYADVQPFHTARFRPSQRVLHAYLSVWNGHAATGELRSMYLDVF